MLKENVYIILNQYSYKISFDKKHAFLPYPTLHSTILSQKKPLSSSSFWILGTLLSHKTIVYFYFFLLPTSSMPCCFPPNDTDINLATENNLTSFYFRANWSLFIKSSLFFSLMLTIFQHILTCTMKLLLLQFLITLFCQTVFHLNVSAVFDITDLSLTLVSVSFCDTFLDHLLLLTSDLSAHSSKEKPQCGGTTNCVLDYCLLFHSL